MSPEDHPHRIWSPIPSLELWAPGIFLRALFRYVPSRSYSVSSGIRHGSSSSLEVDGGISAVSHYGSCKQISTVFSPDPRAYLARFISLVIPETVYCFFPQLHNGLSLSWTTYRWWWQETGRTCSWSPSEILRSALEIFDSANAVITKKVTVGVLYSLSLSFAPSLRQTICLGVLEESITHHVLSLSVSLSLPLSLSLLFCSEWYALLSLIFPLLLFLFSFSLHSLFSVLHICPCKIFIFRPLRT